MGLFTWGFCKQFLVLRVFVHEVSVNRPKAREMFTVKLRFILVFHYPCSSDLSEFLVRYPCLCISAVLHLSFCHIC